MSELTAPVDADERHARMLMSRVAEPGDPDACRLVREYSAAALVERLMGGSLQQSKARDWAERIQDADVEGYRRIADRVAARFIVPGDREWPEQVGDLARLEEVSADRQTGSPFGLWVRGAASAAQVCAQAVAIVGARASTPYGDHVAGDLAAMCADRGCVVVSGGAYGIDAAAHRAALASSGTTVAVLASGIDRLYPSAHSGLLKEIAESGLLVSEAAPGCVPTRSRFLVRNRLIAALSLGTVVVEAALRSGALNTARWSRELDRGVMGVPGPVTSETSAGVHELLRQPGSLLVTDGDEVVEHISPLGRGLAPVKTGPVGPRDHLDARSRQVLEAVPTSSPAASESIARVAGLAHDDVLSRLSALRRLGLVASTPAGWRLTEFV
ncbi:MAG: DNA-processing protein DprA [Nocardioidaceae bacterium]